MLVDFTILDMKEDGCTQDIIMKPFFTSKRCETDVNACKLTFDVRDHHAEFGLFNINDSFLSSFSCYRVNVLDTYKNVKMVDLCPK